MNANWTPWALGALLGFALLTQAAVVTRPPCPRPRPTLEEMIQGQIDKLKDPRFEVRRDAAKTLGMRPADSQRAIPALIEALQDPHPEVREAAATALSRIGGTAVKGLPELSCALAMLPRGGRR